MERIGKYKIQEELGRGGFGQVYRALDTTMGRTVAIKLIHGAASMDEQLLARFKAEVMTLASLNHRNIVTIYGTGDQDGYPYLVMEYLEGQDLQRIISMRQPLSLLDKLLLMQQVAAGLKYAHSKHIVHRDVKPANIMVLNEGTAKLLDFGIARVLRDQTTTSSLTVAGSVIGTLAYMSPEHFGGKVDELSDIFSYGVVYYELVAGVHPFRPSNADADPTAFMRSITTDQPRLITQHAAECPDDLQEIILKLLNKNPKERYPSLDDLQDDVSPIISRLENDLAHDKASEAERLFEQGQINQAAHVIRQAVKLASGNEFVQSVRQRIQQQIQLQSNRERSEQILSDACTTLAAGNFNEAIKKFEEVLRLNPMDSRAAMLLEDAQAKQRRAIRAKALLEKAEGELRANDLSNAHSSLVECLRCDAYTEEANRLLQLVKQKIEKRDLERHLIEALAQVELLIADGS